VRFFPVIIFAKVGVSEVYQKTATANLFYPHHAA
jgi:hypothetical protein